MSVVIERPVNPLFWAFAAMTLGLIVFLPVAMIKPRRDRSAALAAKSAEPQAGTSVKLPASALTMAHGTENVVASPLGATVSVADLTLTPQAQMLIAQIAQLDDEHEAGRIEDEDYQARRAAWKAQLIDKLNA